MTTSNAGSAPTAKKSYNCGGLEHAVVRRANGPGPRMAAYFHPELQRADGFVQPIPLNQAFYDLLVEISTSVTIGRRRLKSFHNPLTRFL